MPIIAQRERPARGEGCQSFFQPGSSHGRKSHKNPWLRAGAHKMFADHETSIAHGLSAVGRARKRPANIDTASAGPENCQEASGEDKTTPSSASHNKCVTICTFQPACVNMPQLLAECVFVPISAVRVGRCVAVILFASKPLHQAPQTGGFLTWRHQVLPLLPACQGASKQYAGVLQQRMQPPLLRALSTDTSQRGC